MAIVQKIDSNATGLRYQEETSIGVANTANDWVPLEPNSYDDFGGEITTVARNPINASRQRQKGVTVDLDASGGFNTDWTQSNLQDILQGFFFADLRPKEEVGGAGEITNVDNTGNDYEAASGLDVFAAGDLVSASGFTNEVNNGVKRVSAAAAASLTVESTGEFASTLVNETPPSAAKLVKVGIQGTAGDIDVDASLTLPALTTTTVNWSTEGLIPGEWIYIGGDTAGTSFTNAANNGFARVYTVAAARLDLDKTASTMVTEASTTETIQVFYGRVLKNESDPTLIIRRTYQLERTLGAPDDASPAQIQAEYLEGAVPNEITFNFSTADKINADLSFVALDRTTIDGPTALKAGARPALVSEDAYNTSNDFSRLELAILDRTAGSNADALFAFLQEFTLTINNNVSPNKAISRLGAFEVTAGQFNVEGTATAYFSTVDAVAAVRNNSDVTLDFALVKNNAGIVVDVPLIALGNGLLDVAQDEPITLPLDTPAAADREFDHTLLMTFFDYLPDAADT